MKVATSEQMRTIDKTAIKEYGIPGIILMENAGKSVADEIIKSIPTNKTIGVFTGSGNNGGDGFVVARHLFLNNFDIRIFFAGKKEKFTESALINYNICNKLGIEIIEIGDESKFKNHRNKIKDCDIIVDAILGTGLNSALKGNILDIVNYINSLNKYVISVDIPTGIFSDKADIESSAIYANKTITFGLPKIGHILSPAKKYVGELQVKNIGFPSLLLNSSSIKLNLITKDEIKKFIPERASDSHKGNFGHLSIFAGSIGKTGAAILSSTAAIKSGVGLVTTICPDEINSILETSMYEVMTLPVKLDAPENAIQTIKSLINKTEVIAAGCGITTSQSAKKILEKLLEFKNKIFVLDADAINIIAETPNIIKNSQSRFILTPHIGEMARLLKTSTDNVLKNRIDIAQKFAIENKLILVLKSSETIIASPEGEIFINNIGNEGMATAGSGDVLTGLIAGVVAQNIKQNKPLFETVAFAVYLHSLAGDIARSNIGSHSLIATDIIDNIKEAYRCLLQPTE